MAPMTIADDARRAATEPGGSRHDHDQLAALIDGIAADVRFSGVIRVDLDGRATVQRAYGLAHRGLDVPNTVDTQFGIASGTKGLTALTVMSLVERGELGWTRRPGRCSARPPVDRRPGHRRATPRPPVRYR